MLKIFDLNRYFKEQKEAEKAEARERASTVKAREDWSRWNNVKDKYQYEVAVLVKCGYSVPEATAKAAKIWDI